MTAAPKPGTAAWAAKVTASKVAAILGVSPFESPFSIWQLMAGNVPPAEENRAMKRGNMLENAVLDWWLDEHPDHVEVARQKWYPLGDWAGATPDLDTTGPTGDLELVDAKTIYDDSEWDGEPPAYYIASSMWQLACAPEAQRVHLAVLFGRPFDLRTFTVERDDELITRLVNTCRAFYQALQSGVMPDLDDSVATYEAVRALHPLIAAKGSDDEFVEIERELAHEYVTAALAVDTAEDRARAAKTRLLDAMGKARIATCDGAKVARRQPHGERVSLVRTAKHIDPGEATP